MENHSVEQMQIWRKFYEENGYLVIPEFISSEQADELRKRAHELVEEFFKQELKRVSIFTTNQQERKSDEYFISSGDKIRFFFEEEAFDKNGNLICPKEKSINKIGHALFELDPVFKKFTLQKFLIDLAKGLGLDNPLMAQSMYIFKQPQVGGKVDIHQDSTFINTKPHSCMAFWFALEDATIENSCLWVVPGSHGKGIVTRFKRNENGTLTLFSKADSDEIAPWTSLENEFDKEKYIDKWVPLPCKKGSLVVIHGSVVHMSEPNRSTKSREVYTYHMIDKKTKYSHDNWLQRPDMPFQELE